MRVVVECSPCHGRARIVVILSLVGYFTSRSFSWYFLVPSTMRIVTSRGLLQWLAGWPPFRAVLRVHSKRTQLARLHVSGMCTPLRIHGTACSVLVSAKTHIELTWPNGPMVAVSHARHNNRPIHCLNYSGGDNRRGGPERDPWESNLI